jgi:hypothetical protein
MGSLEDYINTDIPVANTLTEKDLIDFAGRALGKGIVDMEPGNMTEEEVTKIGLSIADFFNTPGGEWLLGMLKDKENTIAKEAIYTPAKEYSLDWYKGRVFEARSLLVDLETIAQTAVAQVREMVADEEARKRGGQKEGRGDMVDEENTMIPRSGSGSISAPAGFGDE